MHSSSFYFILLRKAKATAKISIQTDEKEIVANFTIVPLQPLPLDGRKYEGHNANGIFNIPMLTDFIHATNTHLANCGCPMDILVFINKFGAAISEIWQCPRCRKCLELNSSKMIKTPVTEPGRKRPRLQPDAIKALQTHSRAI